MTYKHARARGRFVGDEGLNMHRPTVLPLRAFSHAGMFDHKGKGSKYQLTIYGVKFICRYDVESETIELVGGGASEEDPYSILTTEDFAGRRFLLCDCCTQCRTALVLEDNQFLCREVYRHDGRRFSKARRAALFTSVMEDLQELGIVAEPCPSEDQPTAPYRPATKEQAPDPRLAEKKRYSTETAIALGRGAAQYSLVEDYLAKPRQEWEACPTASDYERPSSSSLTDAHPLLDINKLVTHDILEEGACSARTLCWGERGIWTNEVLFILDWRGEFPFVIAAHDFSAEERRRWQRLPLIRQANGRLRWTCPVRKVNCDKLYLRNGLFASREAQWLVSPSQRAEGRAVKQRRNRKRGGRG